MLSESKCKYRACNRKVATSEWATLKTRYKYVDLQPILTPPPSSFLGNSIITSGTDVVTKDVSVSYA